MIITLKNTTKQMRVYQLEQRYAAGEYKSRSENVIRIRQRADGGADIRQQRLRHGPVLRLLAGEVKEVPAALLHDPKLRRDTKGKRPPLKILKRETEEEYLARLQPPAKAAQDSQDAGPSLADDQSADDTAGYAQPSTKRRSRKDS